MSEHVIPVELETGIPLPIEPRDNLPQVLRTGQGADTHHLIYPRTRKELQTDEGKLMRSLCLEWVDEYDHDDFHYHFDDYMANKWKFPKNGPEKLGMSILYAAQYTPPQAIQITNSGPRYVDLDETRRQQMWESGILRYGSHGAVYKLIRESVLKLNLDDLVTEGEIDMLIRTTDTEQRLAIGNKLMALAVQEVVEPIRPVYAHAYERRLIMPDAYREPRRQVLKNPLMLGTSTRQRRIREAIRNHLSVQHKLAKAA